VLGSMCLDQMLDDSDVERLDDHFKVKDLALGPFMNFDFHVISYWPCFGHLPSPIRDVTLDFGHSHHF